MSFRLICLVLAFSFSVVSLDAAEVEVPKDLKKTALSFKAKVRELTPENCATDLRAIYHSLYNFKPTYFTNLESLSDTSLSSNPLNIFFRTRLALHDKFRKWSWDKEFGSDVVQGYKSARECAKMVKVTNRILRGFEEYWGLYKLEKENPELQENATFQGGWPRRMLRPKYRDGYSFPHKAVSFAAGSLKTGDMLLTRGTAFSSAAISRIGDVDNQFSHLALVWIDKEGRYEHFDKVTGITHPAKANQVFLLEALLQGGVQVSIAKEWAGQRFGRMVHFRYIGDGSKTDKQLQAIRDKAAELLFVNAKIPHGQAGHINYNYSMEMNSLAPAVEETTLFCSQAVSYAYKKSCESLAGSNSSTTVCPVPAYTPSNRIFPFPMVYSKLPVDTNPLAQILGLTGKEVFAPADIEIDPQVEIIAEWRNYALIEERRIHDMSLTKVFQWLEKGNYNFKKEMPIYEQIVDISEFLVKTLEKMPPETPRGFVKGTGLMAFMIEAKGIKASVVDIFIEKIKNKDAAAISELLKGSQLLADLDFGIPEDRIDEAIEKAHPILMQMIESGQLKRFLTYSGFTSRLKDEAIDFRQATGFPPTDFVFDRAMEKLRIKYCTDFKSGAAVRLHDFFAESFVNKDKACSTDPKDYKKGGRFDWRKMW